MVEYNRNDLLYVRDWFHFSCHFMIKPTVYCPYNREFGANSGSNCQQSTTTTTSHQHPPMGQRMYVQLHEYNRWCGCGGGVGGRVRLSRVTHRLSPVSLLAGGADGTGGPCSARGSWGAHGTRVAALALRPAAHKSRVSSVDKNNTGEINFSLIRFLFVMFWGHFGSFPEQLSSNVGTHHIYSMFYDRPTFNTSNVKPALQNTVTYRR